MIGIIAARSINKVIGKNGVIPWNIDGEKQQFKELTTGNIVIMGRKTYEEIGRPLPNRTTIVVSKTKSFQAENLTTAGSLKEALQLAAATQKNIYIAGGSSLYKEALPLADKIYLTEVQLVIPNGDAFFPDFDETPFTKTVSEPLGEEIKYVRVIYTRK